MSFVPPWLRGGSSGPGMPPAPTQQGVDRRKQIAEALMRVGQQGTGLSGPWGGIASALAGGIAGYQQRKAQGEQTTLGEDRKRKIAEALSGVTGPQNAGALAAIQQLPLATQEQVLAKGATDKLFATPTRDKIDAGDRYIITENGKVVQEIAKGASPDTSLTNDTTRRGQDITARTTTRGQDITAATATRGQDISSETTRRGQDISASTAAAGQDVTMRGQDITAQTARAAAGNRPLTEYQSKAVGQLTRMQGAEAKLQELEAGGFSPSYVDKGLAAIGNFAERGQSQQYKQAAGEFIAGILRLDSGAAVPEVEFDRYFKNYFPQPGDSQEVVAQKAESRKRATDALRTGIGSAAALVPQQGGAGLQPAAQLAANGPVPDVPQVQAPPAALQFLSQNPTPENKAQFQAKFGYLPPGI